MPFMIGKSPIRRTLPYLKSCDIYFRETVKIFSVNYNGGEGHHKGAKDFVFWHLPQIQFKNPDVQCVTFKRLTPSPFLRIFFENGKSVLIDVDSRPKEDIYHHLKNFTAVCKSKDELRAEADEIRKKYNKANFGFKCHRQCMCEVQGQVPCPGIVPVPYYLRGSKTKNIPLRIPDYLKLAELNESKKIE